MSRLIIMAATLVAVVPSAWAFDCAKARSAAEKTICSDTAAKAADDEMAAAYAAVMAKLPADQQKELKASQKAWLGQRDGYCADDKNTPACFLEKTNERTRYLTGTPTSGPGATGPLMPFLFSQAAKKGMCEIEIQLHKFVTEDSAGAKAFNAAMSKRIADITAPVDDVSENCSYSSASAITYASPDLIAVNLSESSYDGGAHGMFGQTQMVFNMSTGKTPVIAEIFDAKAQKALSAACSDDIKAEKKRRYSEFDDSTEMMAGLDAEMAGYAEAIAEAVGSIENWIIYEDRAEVYFGPYVLGSYVEGDYTCKLPADLLKKNAGKSGWIIP